MKNIKPFINVVIFVTKILEFDIKNYHCHMSLKCLPYGANKYIHYNFKYIKNNNFLSKEILNDLPNLIKINIR